MFTTTNHTCNDSTVIETGYGTPQAAIDDYTAYGWEEDAAALVASHVSITDAETGQLVGIIRYVPNGEFPLLFAHIFGQVPQKYQRVPFERRAYFAQRVLA